MIEKNSWMCNVMSIDVLNEKIAKQQEKLNQLKAQKQAIEAKKESDRTTTEG